MKNKRTKHNPSLKAKVAIAAVQEQQSVAELAKQYKVHPNQIYQWKKQLLDGASTVFERGMTPSEAPSREADLLRKIGELTVERDFFLNGHERFRSK